MQKKTNFNSQKLNDSKLDSHSTVYPDIKSKNNSTTQLLNTSTFDGVAIKVEGVSKKYCKSLKRSMLYGVKDIARNTLGLSSHSDKLRKNEFWALDDISFEVKKGETLGVIGPNGSGKTTLLKLLNGIFWPDKGKISIKGKVGALIEVGAGFHPLLTGRENIYINAAILGMNKKEVDEKFDSIVEFADIGDFIDVPVKFYSSGMFVRLGFAVAVHCKPDILLVDEVLAVGDEKFRRKSYHKMQELIGKTSIIMVSHNMFQINKLCNKVIYLDKGKIKTAGTPEQAIADYYIDSHSSEKREKGIKKEETIEFEDVYFENNKGKRINRIAIFEDVKLILKFKCLEEITEGHFSFRIYGAEGILLSQFVFESAFNKNNSKSHLLVISIKRLNLPPGNYDLEIKVAEKLYIAGIWYNALNFEVYTDNFNLLHNRKGYCILDACCNYDKNRR